MTKKRARLYILLLCMVGFGSATALVLIALRENISYFRTPTEIVTGHYPERASGRGFRLGGLVEKGSLHHEGAAISFKVTDLKNELTVRYQGMIPDLFREGQGVVSEGHMGADGIFIADTLLAKHDEKYMPPAVTRTLKENAPAVSPAEPILLSAP